VATQPQAESTGLYHVLVVDDEDAVRRFVVHVLRTAGYHVAEATDATGALELSQFTTFDVLVTDVVMPGMTGDELARQLRQKERGLKVLYLTGYSDRLFQEKPFLWADEAFLDKPFTSTGLNEALSLLLVGRIDPTFDATQASSTRSRPKP
jgi:CheY-like chemotaxis protein